MDAALLTVPLMLNVKLQLPNRSRFAPYLGAGVGGTSSVLDIGHLDYYGTYFSGSTSDVVFAYQGFAGFRIALSETMGLGLEYRYVHSEDPSYDIDWGWFSNLYSDHIGFGKINMHVASIRFDLRF